MEEYGYLSPAEEAKKVTQLERQVYAHAQNLEFEEAARIRHEIWRLETGQLGLLAKASIK